MTDIHSDLPDHNPPSGEIKTILNKSKIIAIVGLSPKEERDSNKVAVYLLAQGYQIVPVNPGQKNILGQTCFKTLKDIPFSVDIVDLFVNSKRVPAIVAQAIEIGAKVIWMQLGVIHHEAAGKARDADITVIINKCIKIEHRNI